MSDPLEEEEIGHTSGLQDDATLTSEVANGEQPFGVFRDSMVIATSLQLGPRTCVLRIADKRLPSSTPFPALLSSPPSIYLPIPKLIPYRTRTPIPRTTSFWYRSGLVLLPRSCSVWDAQYAQPGKK
jgi:hypothetical protein